jgi:hypothetical protein
MKQRVVRGTAVFFATILAFYVLGIVSSLISRTACVRDSEIANSDFLASANDGKRAVRVDRTALVDTYQTLPHDHVELVGSYRRLSRFVPLRLLLPTTSGPAWTYAVGEITPWPFVVRVDYGRRATFSYGLCGSVGTRMYVGLFGKPLLLGEWSLMMW